MRIGQRYVGGLSLIAVLITGVTFATAGTPVSAQTTQPPQQTTLRHGLSGTITAVFAGALTVTGRDGKPVTVRVGSDTRIFERVASLLADIKAGDRVQIVARKAQDGSLTALTVLDSPADLARSGGGSSGTRELPSGKVQVRGSVVSVGEASLSVATGSGPATNVAVPSTARIQRLLLLPATSLSSGMRVTVRGTTNPDGSMAASVIIVAATARQ